MASRRSAHVDDGGVRGSLQGHGGKMHGGGGSGQGERAVGGSGRATALSAWQRAQGKPTSPPGHNPPPHPPSLVPWANPSPTTDAWGPVGFGWINVRAALCEPRWPHSARACPGKCWKAMNTEQKKARLPSSTRPSRHPAAPRPSESEGGGRSAGNYGHWGGGGFTTHPPKRACAARPPRRPPARVRGRPPTNRNKLCGGGIDGAPPPRERFKGDKPHVRTCARAAGVGPLPFSPPSSFLPRLGRQKEWGERR